MKISNLIKELYKLLQEPSDSDSPPLTDQLIESLRKNYDGGLWALQLEYDAGFYKMQHKLENIMNIFAQAEKGRIKEMQDHLSTCEHNQEYSLEFIIHFEKEAHEIFDDTWNSESIIINKFEDHSKKESVNFQTISCAGGNSYDNSLIFSWEDFELFVLKCQEFIKSQK